MGVGTRRQSQSARSCELAVRAVGAAGGRPEGDSSCLGAGRPGFGARARPTARPWGVRPGPATHWLRVRGVWVWGPVTNPTARALASWLCALWGRHLLPAHRASGVGRSSTPDHPSLGRAAGARHPLAVDAGGVGLRTRHQLHSARFCELALRAVGAARGRPGAGVSCLSLACPGSGALPGPNARPWGVQPGSNTHWLLVWGVWVWEPVTNPPVRALASWLCAPWGRRKGARGGASVACVWGIRGLTLSHARPPVLGACGRGPLPTDCWSGGCGPEDPSPTLLIHANLPFCSTKEPPRRESGTLRAPNHSAKCMQ